jgi:hypothetical protein
MKKQELKEQIQQELFMLDETLRYIQEAQNTSHMKELNVIEKAGVAHLMGNVYNGMENIFKRICKFTKHPLPVGDSSHIELQQLFSNTSEHSEQLPILISANIEQSVTALRKFRHRVMHGYGFTIDPELLMIAFPEISPLYKIFRQNLENYLSQLGE